jgi:hypothetical protein
MNFVDLLGRFCKCIDGSFATMPIVDVKLACQKLAAKVTPWKGPC